MLKSSLRNLQMSVTRACGANIRPNLNRFPISNTSSQYLGANQCLVGSQTRFFCQKNNINDFVESGGLAQPQDGPRGQEGISSGNEMPGFEGMGVGPSRKPNPDEISDMENNANEEADNSFYNERKAGLYIFTAASVSLLGMYFVQQVHAMRKDKKLMQQESVTHVGRAHIGGPWKLWTMDGKEFSSSDLEGHNYLIYFGFCNCPDVCPQSLYKISKALNILRQMPENKYIRLKTIFVTVDPNRDKKANVKKFLSFFDDSIIAVTGRSNNDPALKNMMKKFKIYATKIELDAEDENNAGHGPTSAEGVSAMDKLITGSEKPYTLDHTIITYLMNDDNEYLSHIGSNMGPSDIAQHIVTKILQDQREKLLS